jgi:uncharacterized protein
MQSKKTSQNSWVIRIQRGEKIIEQLSKFCKVKKIQGGFFCGLGAVDWVELALYEVDNKKYYSQTFEQAYEMTNITGSIGVETDLVVHAHATFSDSKMQTIAGHLVDGKVSGTAEIYLTKTEKLTKKYDEETGLKLFELND